MESQIKIRATVPEMNTFFEEESGVRYMEIRDRRYSSDEIERMPESKFNSKVFMWAVRLRHPKLGKELHGIFSISEIKKKLEEMKEHTFESLDPDFPKKVKPGDFVVGGENFGCGSSREQAPGVLKALGVQAVVAKSFARIFYRNAINIGLPIIECPEAAKGIEAGDEVEVDFDNGMIYNRTKGTEFKGQPFPEFMQKLIAAGGLVKYTNSKKAK